MRWRAYLGKWNNFWDINALALLKFFKYSIINVLNAFLQGSEKKNFWYKGPPL